MSDYDLSDLDIGTPVPEVKPHDIFGNSSLADAFRRAFKDMNMSNVEFIKAFHSHPTWYTEVHALAPGVYRAFTATRKDAETNMEAAKQVAVKKMVKRVEEMTKMAEKWEPAEDDDLTIRLPRMRELIMEATHGHPGPMGEALIAFFESL